MRTNAKCPWAPPPKSLCTDATFSWSNLWMHWMLSYVGSPLTFGTVGWGKSLMISSTVGAVLAMVMVSPTALLPSLDLDTSVESMK
eukprot:12444025-Ditylum_brightwellii.AAC.1